MSLQEMGYEGVLDFTSSLGGSIAFGYFVGAVLRYLIIFIIKLGGKNE